MCSNNNVSLTHIERDGLGEGLQEVIEQSRSNTSPVMQDPKGYHYIIEPLSMIGRDFSSPPNSLTFLPPNCINEPINTQDL
jgi:hypothetical protein